MDRHHIYADPNPACHFDADADMDPACHCDPSFQIKAQKSKPRKSAQIGSFAIHFGLSSAN